MKKMKGNFFRKEIEKKIFVGKTDEKTNNKNEKLRRKKFWEKKLKKALKEKKSRKKFFKKKIKKVQLII